MRKLKSINVKIEDKVLPLDLVRFHESEFELVKNFVVEQHKNLNDSTYFIIDDIDSELPNILKDGRGAVIGFIYQEKVISIQAVDYDVEGLLNLQSTFQIYEFERLMEIGWAMVLPDFRKIGLASFLLNYLEELAKDEHSNKEFAATVHPNNVGSVALFLNNGYVGFRLKEHFGLIRMLLVKVKDLDALNVDYRNYVEVLSSQYDEQTKLFNNGYICKEIRAEDSKTYLIFFKTI